MAFLDLGNCSLAEVPQKIGEQVWFEELPFAEEWEYLDGEKWLAPDSRPLKKVKQALFKPHSSFMLSFVFFMVNSRVLFDKLRLPFC